MKVLLVSTNRETFVHRVAPIGLLHLAAALEQRGHLVRVVDLMFSKRPQQELSAAAQELEPGLVGLAIRNIDSLIGKDTYRVPELESYVDALRCATRVPIVAGGPGFSLFPRDLMRLLNLDYGIVGEADRSLPALVERLERRQPLEDLPGLVMSRGGAWIANPPDRVDDLDGIPFQAVRHIDARRYARARGNLAVFTRKACPLDCIYCPEARLHGHEVRLRSPEVVVDEIEHIVRTAGVIDFDFADTTFNVPRSHALAVCEAIVRRGLEIRFEVELSPIDQDEESVRLLKAAGCVGVDLTADSGSDRMLGVLRRGFSADAVDWTANLYDKHRIPYTVGFLLGAPGEDLVSVNESIELARRLPGMTSAYFTVGIRLLEGTELLRIALAEGTVQSREGLFQPTFYVSPSFDERCARRLLDACRDNPRLYLSDSFFTPSMQAFLKLADWGNVRPIWKHGLTPKIFEKIVHLGDSGLRWNEARRCYVNAAA